MIINKLKQKENMTVFGKIRCGFTVRRVRRSANKAIDKILTAQVILAEIQGAQEEENEILFWCDRVEDCMFLVNKIDEHFIGREKINANYCEQKVKELSRINEELKKKVNNCV